MAETLNQLELPQDILSSIVLLQELLQQNNLPLTISFTAETFKVHPFIPSSISAQLLFTDFLKTYPTSSLLPIEYPVGISHNPLSRATYIGKLLSSRHRKKVARLGLYYEFEVIYRQLSTEEIEKLTRTLRWSKQQHMEKKKIASRTFQLYQIAGLQYLSYAHEVTATALRDLPYEEFEQLVALVEKQNLERTMEAPTSPAPTDLTFDLFDPDTFLNNFSVFEC
jgi:hypothetical protein